ncbi:MAG TPA: delta-60 repeat domain-containing protein, partial [Methylomirabilota bacterium]|nr:delta-60 repeat domain-containing protein [Methylomirabilota bacterium]
MNTVCVRSAVLVQVISMIGLASASTSSAQLTVAPLPDLQLSKGGKVHAVVVQADGRMIVGGAFRAVNGVPRHNLARINRDGSVDSGWNPDVRGPEGASVHALALHEDAVLVGGRFDQVGGLPRLNVAKVSLAGAGGPDPDWNPGVSAELPAPEPAIVRALVVFGNEVFIGGDFDIVDGRPIRDVARLSLLGNGAADPQWSLALEGRGVWTLALGPVPFGPPVLVPAGAEAEESVTNLYVGGEFALRSTDDEDFVAGDWRHLIRVPVHAPPAPDPAWRPNPNGPVRSLAVGAGTVFAGGTFTEIDGLERLRAARLHVTEDAKGGLVDADWQLAIEPGRQEVDPEAGVAVLWLEQDRLYLGGSFEGVGSQPLRHLIRAAIRGEQLLDAAWRPQPDGPVQALARSESVWLAGGAFEQAGGATALGLARLDG